MVLVVICIIWDAHGQDELFRHSVNKRQYPDIFKTTVNRTKYVYNIPENPLTYPPPTISEPITTTKKPPTNEGYFYLPPNQPKKPSKNRGYFYEPPKNRLTYPSTTFTNRIIKLAPTRIETIKELPTNRRLIYNSLHNSFQNSSITTTTTTVKTNLNISKIIYSQ